MKRFFLVDGHAQIFRAYYAPFQRLSSPTGESVKATHTFTQMILAILREQQPDYLAIAMDVSDSTTLRREIDPEYKATREETPEDLPEQIDRIVEIIETMSIPIFRLAGYEADDIIATVAERLGPEVELFVVSKDKDLYQIMGDQVHLWDPVDKRAFTVEDLRAAHGFGPDLAVEVQTLTGDSTDNVPGVKGIGVKKAVALLDRFGSAENVLAHASELTPKMSENVRAFADQLDRTRQLVTLRTDVPIEFDLDACQTHTVPTDALRPIFRSLQLRRLLAQLDEIDEEHGGGEDAGRGEPTNDASDEGDSTPSRPKGEYEIVDTEEKLDRFIADLEKQSRFALDAETTSLRPRDALIVGLAFSWSTGTGFYLPLRSHWGETLPPESTIERLRPILEDAAVGKCGQNLKYDMQVLRAAGIELRGVEDDSMVASYLLHPERSGHSLDALAKDLLDHETIPISKLIGSGKEEVSMLDVDLEQLTEYAAEDADVAWQLCDRLGEQIGASPMADLYRDVELPLVEVLADMEYSGVALDTKLLEEISTDLRERIEELRRSIYDAAGREFAIDSPKQLGVILFDELGFRVVKKTKTSRSTDAEVLGVLSAETAHPLPGLVLDYRELTKLLSTYVEPLPGMVSPHSGRLHASFHQAVAATGRLSSSSPNLQNIPVRTEQGRQIRRAFVARDEDHRLVVADYSQIELRVLAHFSRDEQLLDAFARDRDIHAFVAAQIDGIPIEDVTDEQRTRAKAVNFGIIYGQSAFGLAKNLGISRADAASFIAEYKGRYPGIVRFMEQCVAEAEAEGRVSTLLGRQRVIPEIHSKNRMRRNQGERLAINTVVQGSAADIIKVAMVRLHRRVRDEKLPISLLIQVHDELLVECPRSETERCRAVLRDAMENAVELDVRLRVDVGEGSNWLEAK